MDDSITLINVDNSVLHTEGNECVTIAIPVTKSTFKNDYIHLFNDISKGNIYGYLISKLIGS